jgi:hypothetical protein
MGCINDRDVSMGVGYDCDDNFYSKISTSSYRDSFPFDG